jgi:NAD+ synthase
MRLDVARATREITDALRHQVGQLLRRSGLVVAMSGGVDSALCAALAVAAVGPRRVLGLALPEKESDPVSLGLARDWARQLDIDFVIEDISGTLAACGAYAQRDEAIQRLIPEYDRDWKCKLIIAGGGLDPDRLQVCQLAVQPPGGELRTVRLPAREFRQIVAATNYKQRVRKMREYYHADRLHYAVVGTPNRLEYDQGFFVKGGDGLADVKPIAHLYKSQVYELAEHLGVPDAIRSRTPTTDTYSLPQTQEEFYFTLPLRELDLVLQAHNAGASAETAAADLGYEPEQIERVYRDLERKRRTTRGLHLSPLLSGPVPEISTLPGGDDD